MVIFLCQVIMHASVNEAMHVGDDFYADIYGAKKVGMKTCFLGLGTRICCNVEPDCVISELKKFKKILSSE